MGYVLALSSFYKDETEAQREQERKKLALGQQLVS